MLRNGGRGGGVGGGGGGLAGTGGPAGGPGLDGGGALAGGAEAAPEDRDGILALLSDMFPYESTEALTALLDRAAWNTNVAISMLFSAEMSDLRETLSASSWSAFASAQARELAAASSSSGGATGNSRNLSASGSGIASGGGSAEDKHPDVARLEREFRSVMHAVDVAEVYEACGQDLLRARASLAKIYNVQPELDDPAAFTSHIAGADDHAAASARRGHGHSSLSDRDGSPENRDYQEMRREAIRQACLRKVYFAQAQRAFAAGKHSDGRRLIAQGKEAGVKMAAAHESAGRALFQYTLFYSSSWSLFCFIYYSSHPFAPHEHPYHRALQLTCNVA